MKKLSASMLAAVTGIAVCVSACGAPKEETSAAASSSASASASASSSVSTSSQTQEKAAPEAVTVGGWEIVEGGAGNLPDGLQKAFDKAMESYDGMDFEPIALLGSQVVAGLNYQILCSGEPVAEDPVTQLYVVTIYADLKDNVTVTNVADFDLGAIEESGEKQPQTEILAGGWSAPQKEDVEGVSLPQDAATAFSEATGDLTGVDYIPEALLGTKVIAGTEYAFLVLATPVTKNPVSYDAVMFVAANADKTYDLMSVVPLDLTEYTK